MGVRFRAKEWPRFAPARLYAGVSGSACSCEVLISCAVAWAAPSKADWEDPSVREKAKVYRTLLKQQPAHESVAIPKPQSAPVRIASKGDARHQSLSVARLLRKSKCMVARPRTADATKDTATGDRYSPSTTSASMD